MMTRFALVMFAVSALGGCAYRFGQGARSLPGGYRQMSIPIFKNRSQESGIEVSFTQALMQEFLRSKVARVVDDPLAEVRVEGEVASVDYQPDAKQAETTEGSSTNLPKGTVIATQYRVIVVVDLRIIRRSDGEKLWEGRFNGDRPYSAPIVMLTGLNSADPLYNLSARRQTIDVIASDMMVEAHGRMTENF